MVVASAKIRQGASERASAERKEREGGSGTEGRDWERVGAGRRTTRRSSREARQEVERGWGLGVWECQDARVVVDEVMRVFEQEDAGKGLGRY